MITALRRGKRLVSFKVETGVILGTIIVLLVLPGAAVASMTNISDMLKNDVSPGDSGGSDTRAYLGNLITPGYVFLEGMEPYTRSGMLLAYTYTNADVQMGRRYYHGSSGVGNIGNYNYINALAPPYTSEDAQLLEGHNVQTYHAHKLAYLLGAMEGIAQEAG